VDYEQPFELRRIPELERQVIIIEDVAVLDVVPRFHSGAYGVTTTAVPLATQELDRHDVDVVGEPGGSILALVGPAL